MGKKRTSFHRVLCRRLKQKGGRMQRPPPPSLHSNFFSSLRQVEKRLKLEHPPKPPTPPPANSQTQDGEYSSLGSLSSPMFLHLDQSVANSSNDLCGSEPPRAFLSVSPDFALPNQQSPPHSSPQNRHIPEIEAEDDEIDEIEQLIGLLWLPEEDEDDEEGGNDCNSCHCAGGFYSKIVGVKGPKCGKEMKRLDGWIKYFREEKKEPLRLAHLLLGKRIFLSEGVDDDHNGFGGLEFPSTIQEFLHTDPPD